ncbi:MAG: hypothetical protein K9J13_13455 [Saprospiraceae bacterium]|nr:hypothetical protein [Saprospiraceae bacterium]
MRKIFKIILICIIAAFGIFCGYGLYEEIKDFIDSFSTRGYYFDEILLIPISLFLLFIPSMIFNIKTIKIKNWQNDIDDSLLDYSMANEINANRDFPNINKFLWISNIIFGLITSFVGIVLIYDSFYTENKNDPEALPIFLVCFAITFAGILIIIDEIYLLILKKKQKTKLKELH